MIIVYFRAMKKLALHWKILIGVVLGIVTGIVAKQSGNEKFVIDWIYPFGNMFLNMLKLIAVPLVLVSLIDGISNLKHVSGLSRMGFRTIVLYLSTTVTAITIGLLLVNILQPGEYITEEKKIELQQKFIGTAGDKIQMAEKEQAKGPLSMLQNIVPDNLFASMTDNRMMLQVIFFAMVFGIAMVLLPMDKTKPVKDFFNSMNHIILRLVEIFMQFAPFGVFALLAGMDTDTQMLISLGMYCLCVLCGLATMLVLVYPLLLRLFTKHKVLAFYRGILPVQLLAFSTSSSAAALGVNIECCEKNLKLREETTGFVLPLGATVNMDGTSLYQAVAAVFISQVYGYDLTLSDQLIIILSATLASIGAAPVPGAGMVMLVIILQSVGIAPEGLVIIIGVDRLLDMFRTIINVTSDAAVACIVDDAEVKRESKLSSAQ
jgi:Na+/H+-dicarboxylate symporter